jgi:hypothetical protein
MIVCALLKDVRIFHLGYLYYASQKDKPVREGGVVSGFKRYPRDKQGLRKIKVRLQRIKYWMATN